MAVTRTQGRVEAWIRDQWLPKEFRRAFTKRKLNLSSGGSFEFDAVSSDRRVVVTVSTSRSRTSSGRDGAGKMNKIRSDIMFLSLRKAPRRVVVLTERDMFRKCTRQQDMGRLPRWVKFLLAPLPKTLAKSLRRARRKSSREVSPGRRLTSA
jgi:hypothetical protein